MSLYSRLGTIPHSGIFLTSQADASVFLIDFTIQVVKYILGYALWLLQLSSCFISSINKNNKLAQKSNRCQRDLCSSERLLISCVLSLLPNIKKFHESTCFLLSNSICGSHQNHFLLLVIE